MSVRSASSANLRIFYPGPRIVITDAYIETSEARYPIRKLAIRDPHYSYAYPARAVALYCGAVELMLALCIAALAGSLVPLAVTGVIAGAGMAAAAWLDDRRNPRQMELIAWYEGRRVMLYASGNQREFERVRRAVVRAVEADCVPRP